MKKKIVFVAIGIVLLVGIAGYNYLYQGHREILTEEPVAVLTSEAILKIFKDTESPEILNATVLVKGTISELTETSLTLDDMVSCSLTQLPEGLSVGKKIELKGRCIGYDELFEIVKMDQCNLLKN